MRGQGGVTLYLYPLPVRDRSLITASGGYKSRGKATKRGAGQILTQKLEGLAILKADEKGF